MHEMLQYVAKCLDIVYLEQINAEASAAEVVRIRGQGRPARH